jgi:hypothetical protein
MNAPASLAACALVRLPTIAIIRPRSSGSVNTVAKSNGL